MKDETEQERVSRNWDELLQELRVTQTGTQVLTGFLLTLAFQSRFSSLDEYQVGVYLALISGAALATVLGLAPVSLHRRFFRKGKKPHIVALANRLLQLMLIALALVLSGTVLFIFDLVVGRTAGYIAGATVAAAIVVVWLAVPSLFRARLPDHGKAQSQPQETP